MIALTNTSFQVGDEALLVECGVDREAVEEEDAHDEEDVEEAEGADLERAIRSRTSFWHFDE